MDVLTQFKVARKLLSVLAGMVTGRLAQKFPELNKFL
ncbi:hypothetical protein [Rosenbergiella australiborealis]